MIELVRDLYPAKFQKDLKNIYYADKLDHTDGQTDRQTEQAGAGNYNTPLTLGSRVNNSVTHVIHNMLGVSGLATDYLSGVWGRGEQLASDVMVHFLIKGFQWQMVCKFGIVERNFVLISCLYSCFYKLPRVCLLFSSQLFYS